LKNYPKKANEGKRNTNFHLDDDVVVVDLLDVAVAAVFGVHHEDREHVVANLKQGCQMAYFQTKYQF
jgi:hypothetical protein